MQNLWTSVLLSLLACALLRLLAPQSLDFANLVYDEKDVQNEIIDASGVKFGTLVELAAIAKAWWLCRSASVAKDK